MLIIFGPLLGLGIYNTIDYSRTDPRSILSFSIKYADYNKVKKIKFKSGENILQGYLIGDKSEKGLIVFSHGRDGNAESYFPQQRYFVENGWQVFAFNNTGVRTSAGSSRKGFVQAQIDLHNALTFIKADKELNQNKIFLFGHSMGGYAVTSVLNYEHSIAAVVSVAGVEAPFTADIPYNFNSALEFFGHPWNKAYYALKFKKAGTLTATQGINASNTPVLLVHDKGDGLVRFSKNNAIISHTAEFTNKNVKTLVLESGLKYAHSDILISNEAIAYETVVDKQLVGILEKYDGSAPPTALEFIDREKLSKPNEELLKQIDQFYSVYI